VAWVGDAQGLSAADRGSGHEQEGYDLTMDSDSPPDSLKGQLLLSSARLDAADFRQTVILVGEHNRDGALGVVLNRPLGLTVSEGFPALAPLVGGPAVVFRGGPVQPESPVLLAEFARREKADLPVFGRVGFLIGDVPEDIGPEIERARIFAGYAGWGAGQLEEELEGGAWIVESARADDVFTEDAGRLWARILQRMGPDFERMARVPFDPRVN
jgi:putative transcriptional regulator